MLANNFFRTWHWRSLPIANSVIDLSFNFFNRRHLHPLYEVSAKMQCFLSDSEMRKNYNYCLLYCMIDPFSCSSESQRLYSSEEFNFRFQRSQFLKRKVLKLFCLFTFVDGKWELFLLCEHTVRTSFRAEKSGIEKRFLCIGSESCCRIESVLLLLFCFLSNLGRSKLFNMSRSAVNQLMDRPYLAA